MLAAETKEVLGNATGLALFGASAIIVYRRVGPCRGAYAELGERRTTTGTVSPMTSTAYGYGRRRGSALGLPRRPALLSNDVHQDVVDNVRV